MSPADSHGHGIVCPIDLFSRIERQVEETTAAINRASTPAEKAQRAGELRAAVSRLLECKAYDEDNLNCRLCREFSKLRDQTAAVVEQAARLAR